MGRGPITRNPSRKFFRENYHHVAIGRLDATRCIQIARQENTKAGRPEGRPAFVIDALI
jgi:hypothetical protein